MAFTVFLYVTSFASYLDLFDMYRLLKLLKYQSKSSKGDSNCIWKTIRLGLPSGESNRPVFTKDATVVAEEFNNFFATVGINSARLAEEITHKFDLPPYIQPLAPDTII